MDEFNGGEKHGMYLMICAYMGVEEGQGKGSVIVQAMF